MREEPYNLVLSPIGVIHSPFNDLAQMPIQPTGAQGVSGEIVLEDHFAEGLADLEGFSHLIVLYHFHRAAAARLSVTPFLDSQPRGIFATRAPTRPNPIGISVLKLIKIGGLVLQVENVDILDGTPLLDIKPYVPAFDQAHEVRVGWLEGSEKIVAKVRSDERFR